MFIPIFIRTDECSGADVLGSTTCGSFLIALAAATIFLPAVDYARCRYLVGVSALPYSDWHPIKGCYVTDPNKGRVNVLITKNVWHINFPNSDP